MLGNRVRPSNRGSGVIMGFFVIMILVTLGVSFLSVTATSIITSKHDGLRTRAMACAEAGVDKAAAAIMTSLDDHPSDTIPPTALGGNDYYTVSYGPGSGITNGKIVVTSTGTATEAGVTITRTIKVVYDYRKENVNVWSNAIFGGVGQSGKSINGNVKIRGSVHLLGDGEAYTDTDGDGHYDAPEPYTDSNHNGQWDQGEPYTDLDADGRFSAGEPFQDVNGNGYRDPALTVTDLAEEISGNADMANNYSGMAANLRTVVPNPPTKLFGGENVESLSAKVRVKHGRVNISGSAVAGYANVTGNSTKETLDGAYVSDGFGGTAGTAAVHSDNGFSNGYDLGDGVVDMPLLTFGSYTKDGITYDNYLSYLQQTSTVYAGSITIKNGVPMNIVGPNGSLTVDAAGNMNITGKVYITGNISFDRAGPITYSGSGSLCTPENVYIHCNVLPQHKFTEPDTLGVIAAKKIELATGAGDAQLTMALAMYGQQQIVSNKQNEVAGTMVTSYFSMANVPKLYQVPGLDKHLPPGMPGADPIYVASISVVSWQEVASQ